MNSERKPIRSFVLRQGRVSNAQQRAHDNLLPLFGIEYTGEPLDLAAAFGRNAPVILEIGFGMGESTAAIAEAHPELDFLGIEVHTPGVGSLLKQIRERNLQNLRIIQHDAVEVLEKMIPDGALSGVHIFFPDPWPKKRHHKRRLIQAPLVSLLGRKLAEGGYLHAATDWVEYAEHILETLRAEPALENTAADYAMKPQYRPLTKFEARGIRLGHEVRDIVFRKISAGTRSPR
ncbi:MAG: tRNA (guanosine(46)-N7)-methyltransferase TrmB [Burkholderiales bacterium]|nr:tRNA (guanosine(46)-N7)-methyltransferase TrmB [Burkholderiales bacterium]